MEFTKSLFYNPDVVGLEKFREIVILLLGTDLSELGMDSLIVGRSLNVADDTESDGVAVAVAHRAKIQLRRILLSMSFMH